MRSLTCIVVSNLLQTKQYTMKSIYALFDAYPDFDATEIVNLTSIACYAYHA